MATLTDLIAGELSQARVSEQTRQTWQTFERLLLQVGGALVRVAQSPRSLGYEPWIVERGGGRLGARGLAHVLVRAGKRRANDNQWRGRVVKALRNLAKPLRRSSALRARINTLLQAWEQSSVIETIFDQAKRDEREFVRLLEAARAGDASVFGRLAKLAVALDPFLTLTRGQNRRAASEAHTLFLHIGRSWGGGSYTWDPITADFIDPQTLVTRLEFNNDRFDPRPAYRRAKNSTFKDL